MKAARRALIAGLVAVLVLLVGRSWRGLHKAWVETPSRMAALAAVPNTVEGWPPEVGRPFPDVALTNHLDQPFRVSALRGRPVLVEFVSMTCAGCQGFSGAGEHGAYGGYPAQDELPSVEALARDWGGGTDLRAGDVAFVQLVIYDTALEPPTPEALADWRAHFGLDWPDAHVVTGGAALANGASFRRIPGFLLLDADGVVVRDATGHSPPDDLYRVLLPSLPELARR